MYVSMFHDEELAGVLETLKTTSSVRILRWVSGGYNWLVGLTKAERYSPELSGGKTKFRRMI
jgi:hypothetical protein